MHKLSENAIYLIDGSSFLYRAYYGLRPLHTSKGLPVQATYGFCRMIKRLISDFKPQNMLLVWDSKGATFREEIYEEYKATRQAPPSDLIEQKEQIIDFAERIDLGQLAKTGYEADDLIATVVHEYREHDVVIITPDKDLHQLIAKHVVVYDPFKREMIDVHLFKEQRGFPPEHLLLYHALLGDASDNIPGVRGIGKKGAEELTRQFGTLDTLYNNLDSVEKKRTRTLLEEQKDQAYLSEKLFTLRPCTLSLTDEDIAFDESTWANARVFFEHYEFATLVAGTFAKTVAATSSSTKQMKLFEVAQGREGEPPVKKCVKTNWKCITITDKLGLAELVFVLKKSGSFALDTETTGVRSLQDELVGLSFAVDTESAYYVPVAHNDDTLQLSRDYVLKELRAVLESKAIKKTLQNAKFDALVLWQYGIEVAGVTFDTLLAANVLRKAWQKIGLKSLSEFYLDEPMKTFAEVLGSKRGRTFADVPIADAAFYAAHDALQTLKLEKVFTEELSKEKKLEKIFYDIEMPLLHILFAMERYGITLDCSVLKEIGFRLDKDLEVIVRKLLASIPRKVADDNGEINLNSPQQVEVLLFDVLGLPVVKKSPEGRRSTDHEVLSELSKVHPIPGMIMKYRELFKLKSTYVEPLQGQINPDTGRIHTSFNQTDVSTGRLSSYEPNLQNIPAGEGYGIEIRSAFVAPRGWHFLSADYSQIELRVLAHMTQDETLTNAFLSKSDIHAYTASQVFNIDERSVTRGQRQVGKRINFSIMYGMTPFGLSKDLGIKQSEAKSYIKRYFERYPGVRSWMDTVVEEAKGRGYVETYFGRRRYVPGLKERNRTVYEAACRVAINSPIQGTSAEIMKKGMIALDAEIKKKKLNSQMVLQIHDEIIIECPKGERDDLESIVRSSLEGVVSWKIPLEVDIRFGKNWRAVTK